MYRHFIANNIFYSFLFLALFFFVLPGTQQAYASDSYQSLNSRFVGYSEEEIAPAYFDVHYSGKWKQSHELMGRYSLYRSAELAEEMGFSVFSIESLVLSDEPDVQIYKTCSDIRVVSNTVVPAATVLVRYLAKVPADTSAIFSTQELLGMKPMLLDEDLKFDLYAFLKSHGVLLRDERDRE